MFTPALRLPIVTSPKPFLRQCLLRKRDPPPAGTRPKKREAAESSSADTRRVAARTEADPAADVETKVVALKVDSGAAQGPATPAPPAAVLKHNADHLQYIKECLTVVRNHPVMQGVDELPPSPLSSGAPIAPITNEGVISGLAGSSKCATGGANFFSQNMSLDPHIAHIPVKRKRVDELVRTKYLDSYVQQLTHVVTHQSPVLVLRMWL